MTQVLCVEDDEDMLELIAFMFEQRGVAVTKARSGNQAIKILGNSQPDVILSDVRMPDGNGLELLQHIRGLDPEHRPEVFLLSGYSDYSETFLQRLGCRKLLSKPDDMPKLVDKVIGTLQQAQFDA